MEQNSGVNLFGVNMVFMVTAILLVTIGYFLQTVNIYYGLLVTELVIIIGPVLVYTAVKKVAITDVFRIKPVSSRILVLCALIMLSAYPVGLFLNLVGNLILSLFGDLIPMPIPVAENGTEYVINLLVIALTAGIAEELFFRGLVLKGYEVFGRKKAIIITALLFGIFHFNIQNFIGPVFLGLIFGYLAVKTGSIFPAIVGHFINNALSVTIAFAAELLSGGGGQAMEEGINTPVILAGAAFWGVLALLSAMIMIKLFRKLNMITGAVFEEHVEPYKARVIELFPLLITVLIFAVIAAREFWVIINGPTL